MDFPPEHCFEAANERMRQALYLFKEGARYALAIYVGGVAIECLLRAFKGRRDPSFDEKHDLQKLFAASGMLRLDPDQLRSKGWDDGRIDEHFRALQVAVNQIYQLWGNNYRFASENRLRSHLKKVTGYRKIKGDYLEELARRFQNSVQQFFNKGVMLWPK